jgi:thiosulfate dehydrogenase [quinone] large subunit
MNQWQKISLLLLRLSLGWIFFWSGITKIIDPTWSAVGYLRGAKMFGPFYQWLASADIIPFVNFANEWGLTLLGVSLIIGLGVRLSGSLGILLMILYYLPLGFPYPSTNSFIVDEHIIYMAGLLVLISFRAGQVWGLENWFVGLPAYSKYISLRKLIG